MKPLVTQIGVMLLLGAGGPAGALDLPPDVRADQYLLEATEALEQGDPQTALWAFENIEALDTEPPVEFLFFYGKLLVENSPAVEGVRKGHALLKQFVINVGKASEHYRPTLKLLSVAAGKIEAAERRRIGAAKRQAEAAKRQTAAQQRAKPLLENLKQQMVVVQGGTFRIGEQHSCSGKKKPVRQVQVKSFMISKYEVTQELWEAVMGKNPSKYRNCPRCPVESVSWGDIQTFLKELNTLAGERYRVPTNGEWEYAARGGPHSRGYPYAGSDAPDSVAWYKKNSGNRPHRVGQKKPNELGLYDMSGNVFEMVPNCWNTSYHRGTQNYGMENGDCYGLAWRGGAWDSHPSRLRPAEDRWCVSGTHRSKIGVRLARTLTP